MGVLVIGIDPGFKSSPTAIVILDPTEQAIVDARLFTKGILKETDEIIRYMSRSIGYYLKTKVDEYDSENVMISIEQFVMRGKGGESMNRLIGAIMSQIPESFEQVVHAQNSTVKKYLGGHGQASKEEVAKGVVKWFGNSWGNIDIVEEWIRREQWDLCDALAIGITGYELGK